MLDNNYYNAKETTLADRRYEAIDHMLYDLDYNLETISKLIDESLLFAESYEYKGYMFNLKSELEAIIKYNIINTIEGRDYV